MGLKAGKIDAGASFRSPRSRSLPTKSEIQQRAKENYMTDQAKADLPAITPETEELSEGGYLQEAQHELMRGETTEWTGEQRRYLDQMASDMGLVIVTKQDAKRLEQPETQPQRTPQRPTEPQSLPATTPQKAKPSKARKVVVRHPKPRQPKRKHLNNRSGINGKKWRHLAGVVELSDDEWKVKRL